MDEQDGVYYTPSGTMPAGATTEVERMHCTLLRFVLRSVEVRVLRLLRVCDKLVLGAGALRVVIHDCAGRAPRR